MEAVLEPLAAAISAFQAARPVSATDDAVWRLEVLMPRKPDPRRIAALLEKAIEDRSLSARSMQVRRVPKVDWVARVASRTPPLRLGRYFVHGSHISAVPPGSLGLKIDAGAAFGTGLHGTTRGSLAALDRLASRATVSRTLDIGCGSGVLAVAMAKTWHRPVWAVDIDRVAAGETRANARANGVAHLIHTRCGDALRAPGISRAGPYSIIAANILEGPLRKMSSALARHLSPGSSAVLSGLLPDQAERVRARYRALGLRLRHRIEIDGWVTLLPQKPSYSAASTQQSSVSNRPSG